MLRWFYFWLFNRIGHNCSRGNFPYRHWKVYIFVAWILTAKKFLYRGSPRMAIECLLVLPHVISDIHFDWGLEDG